MRIEDQADQHDLCVYWRSKLPRLDELHRQYESSPSTSFADFSRSLNRSDQILWNTTLSAVQYMRAYLNGMMFRSQRLDNDKKSTNSCVKLAATQYGKINYFFEHRAFDDESAPTVVMIDVDCFDVISTENETGLPIVPPTCTRTRWVEFSSIARLHVLFMPIRDGWLVLELSK
jgi:hypothetical protein